jgi:hypothetical protein
MERIIQTVCDRYWDILKKEIRNKGNCCELDMFYENGAIPDYSSEMSRAYYMLRYFPAFLAEYYFYIKTSIEIGRFPQEIYVVSFGAGMIPDYYSIKLAIRHTGRVVSLANYTGVDKVDWKVKKQDSNFKYIIQDISKIVNIDSETNFIIFPKTVCEFDEATKENIIRLFRETEWKKDKLIILNSSTKNIGSDFIKTLTEVMIKTHKYSTEDDYEFYHDFQDEFINRYWDTYGSKYGNNSNGRNIPIGKGVGCFKYPQEAIDNIKRISQYCPKRKTCSEFDICSSNINQLPILTMKYMKYQHIELKR